MSQAMQASIQPDPRTRVGICLSRREEIVAHLRFAAAEIGGVRVDIGERSHSVALAFPSEPTDSIDLIFPHAVNDRPESGGTVRVRYHHAGNSYEFLAPLSEALSMRRWRLALPAAVSRWTGRREDRYPTRYRAGFRILLERDDGEALPLQIVDLASQGLSFVYPPLRFQLTVEQEVVATLELPDEVQLPVLLEVRHTRSVGEMRCLAGCFIRGISPSSRVALGQALAGLDED